MHRLVINPGTPAEQVIQLREGNNSLGRGPENDFQLADNSVSTNHCEVSIRPDSVLIKDLGSTNGTFVENVPVRQAFVTPGQRVRLGNLEMLLESAPVPVAEALAAAGQISSGLSTVQSSAGIERGTVIVSLPPAPPVSEAAVAPTAPAPAFEEEHPVFCRNHVHNAARHKCTKCGRYLCDLCVNTRGSAAGGLKFCKACAGECAPVTIKGHIPQAVDFFKAVPKAFRYPVVGDGLILLIGGTIFFGFLDAANYIAINSLKYGQMRALMMRAILVTFVLGTGYLFSYLKKVVYSTAAGEQQMPDWPDLSEWHADIVSPMFQFVVISLISFGPAIGLAIWLQGENPWAVWATAVAGCFYFPMAMLGVAMFDSLAALNPFFVVGSILKVPKAYALAAVVFAGIVGIRWLTEAVVRFVIPVPLLPALLADLVGLYLLIVETRILGLLYLSQKARLHWFRK